MKMSTHPFYKGHMPPISTCHRVLKNNSPRYAAPAQPSQFTAMGPSQYAGQMTFTATNDRSKYGTICCLNAKEGDAGKDLKQDDPPRSGTMSVSRITIVTGTLAT